MRVFIVTAASWRCKKKSISMVEIGFDHLPSLLSVATIYVKQILDWLPINHLSMWRNLSTIHGIAISWTNLTGSYFYRLWHLDDMIFGFSPSFRMMINMSMVVSNNIETANQLNWLTGKFYWIVYLCKT